MRNSSFLKWAQNNKNLKLNNNKNNGDNSKNWIHPAETLLQGHVAYLVKFLGSTEVDQPKGIEVVKQGIQKLKFAQQLRRTETSGGNTSSKTPKVELTISAEGVAIQEPKSKRVMHEYPLHKISYCADDKAEKRFFSFIAKEENKHTCFVFVSDKLAEEITLTIGQAFELAYKKFLETSGKELETKKQMMIMQKRIAILEDENKLLKERLRDIDAALGGSNNNDLKVFMQRHKIKQLSEVSTSTECASEVDSNKENVAESGVAGDELICLDSMVIIETNNKLDGITLDDLNDDDFDPRAVEEGQEPSHMPPPTQPPPMLVPPPMSTRMKPSASAPNHMGVEKAGTRNPFKKENNDPFGMDHFHHAASNNDVNNLNNNFNLQDLDPLAKL